MVKLCKLCGFLLALLFAVQVKAQTETIRVWMDDVTLTADSQSVTRLYLYEKDVVNYTAFSLTLNVPKGVKIAQVKQDRNYKNDIRLTERLDDHTISCNMLEDGRTIKIIAYSPSNAEFYPDNVDGEPIDSIFSIGLVAEPAMCNGNYVISIEGCKFVLPDATASVPGEPIEASMTIVGGKDHITIDYLMTDAGVGTLILPFDAEIPDGLRAFKCTEIVGESVMLVEQSRIAANEPLLMAGEMGNYSFKGVPKNNADVYSDGLLTGVYVPMSITEGYMLQSQEGKVGFYKVNPDNPTTVPAYSCFLNANRDIEFFALSIYGTTGLEELPKNSSANVSVFDMQGRKINKVRDRGVYIIDGKKQVVK